MIIETPDEVCGVYHLMLGNKVRYVGQTTNIYSRIGSWKTLRFKARQFDHVAFFPCAVRDLDRLEEEHIKRYQPELNSEGMRKPYRSRPWIRATEQENYWEAIRSYNAAKMARKVA
jgi:excinuclease UvrABC nuclease subunit